MKWEMVKLEEICDINMGKTPSRNNPEYWNGDIPWISISDLKGDYYISSTREGITDLGVKESGIKPVEPNTLLYSFKLSIGKVAITSKKMYTNEAIVALPIKNTNEVLLSYLYWAIQMVDLSGIGDKAVKGITLNKEKLKSLQIPLPPLATQKRIAAILDAADALRRKDQALLQKYDELAQAIFVEMFGDPVKNEKGWEVKKLGECLDKVQIGPFGTQLHESDYIPDGIPLINPMHISDLKIKPNLKYSITSQKYNELKQYHLKVGDVIMGRRGEMGRCALVTELEAGYLCGTGSIILTPSVKSFNPLFLVYLLTRKRVKNKLEEASAGTTMSNLNKTIIENFSVIVPKLELQQKFSNAILINQMNIEKIRTNIEQSKNLFDAILQKAFNAELVP